MKFQIQVLTNKVLWLSHENNILREKETKSEAVRRLNQSEKIEITKYVYAETGKKVRLSVPECPICLEPLCDNLKAFYPCGHVVHNYCCLEMATHGTKRKCPICRIELLRNPLDLFYWVNPEDVEKKTDKDNSHVLKEMEKESSN